MKAFQRVETIAIAAFLLLTSTAGSVLAQKQGMEAIERPGVRLFYGEGVDWAQAEIMAEVIGMAKQAYEGVFPGLAKPEIHVYLRLARDYHESIVTDRRETIYVYTGPKGIGEYFRADAGPVGILCTAVAELYNPSRIPGLDRYMAHRHLVPAATGATGFSVLLLANATAPAEDGEPMLEVMSNPEYTAVHPDFAAVRVLLAIEQQLGLDALKSLLTAIPAQAEDPFVAFGQAAVAKEPALGALVEAYTQASMPPLQPDGTCLIASFEPDEPVKRAPGGALATVTDPLILCVSYGWSRSKSNDWATDGTMSLKLTTDNAGRWGGMSVYDPDWRFKDWRRFSRFEMDLKMEGPGPARIRVFLHDDVGYSHGMIVPFEAIVQPGEEHHVAYALDAEGLKGTKTVRAQYFESFRPGEVAGLHIMVDEADPPFTLYLDNIRLTPRDPQDWPTRVVSEPPAPSMGSGAGAGAGGSQPYRALPENEAGRAHYDAGVEFKEAQRWAEAVMEFEAAVAANPRYVEAYQALAESYIELKMNDRAIDACKKVVELSPDTKLGEEARQAIKRLQGN